MWPELIEDIQLELKLLRRLLEETADLRRSVADDAARQTEKLAGASVLQSFYNGIENVLDLLAERLDDDRPTGPERHRQLLSQMAQPTGARPAVLSGPLHHGLAEYLEFRNAYRYGHYFRLDWPVAAALVGRCEQTLDRFVAELDAFLREHAGQRLIGRAEPAALPDYWFAPPKRPDVVDRRAVARWCTLACLLGIGAGIGLAALVRHLAGRPDVRQAPAEEVRRRTAALAKQFAPWQADPAVGRAAGALGFFERPDWTFTYDGKAWDAGEVRGRCPSLGATATLAFVDGALVRIDVVTSWDRYAFVVAGARLRRAAWDRLPSGRPQALVDFDPNGAPARVARWTDDDTAPSRHETFYHDGRAIVQIESAPDGTLRRVLLRTDPATRPAAFRDVDGRLQPAQAGDTTMQDLPSAAPPPPSTSPAG